MDHSEHKAIADVYAADTTTKFGKAMFHLLGPRLDHQMFFIALLPIKFELACMVSGDEYKEICDQYVRASNKKDIWLRRSPVNPLVKLVRHSDYTPLWLLKKSSFYRDIMQPMNGEHGASIVAWHGENWLATLTVLKNRDQGDFTDEEMQRLESWQVHFEAGAHRIALAKENRLDEESLSNFIWDLPSSALILDWDLTPRHFNAAAVELCNVWQYGVCAFNKKISHQRLRVPKEILDVMPELKPRIEATKPSRPGPTRRIEFQTLLHPRIKGLSAKLYFIPAKSLSLTRGRFLVQFNYHPPEMRLEPGCVDLSVLSRPVRKVAIEAARGLTNPQIGRLLGKSAGTVKLQLTQVFKKLNVKSRVELAKLLASSNGVLKTPRSEPLKRSRGGHSQSGPRSARPTPLKSR